MSILDGNKQSILVYESPILGESLLERGWRQGALFSATSACFTWNALLDSGADELITQQRRKTKPGEKFVIITQDCDIGALEQQEPYVEALLCKIYKNREFLSKIGRNSARWFAVNFDTGIVAEARYRVQFAKQVLRSLNPEPWPASPKRLEQFIRWLARRYDRPALPDTIVDSFQRPVEQVFNLLVEEQPDIVQAFNEVIHEVRISLPTNENPPFNLQLVLLIDSDGPGREQADAIDVITRAVRANLNPKDVHLHPEVRIVTEERISMAEYYATRPLFLEYFTYKGDEIEGVEPYSRV